MSTLKPIVPLAKRIKYHHYKDPYQVYSGQSKSEVGRAEKENIVWRNNILVSMTCNIKQNHYKRMDNIEMNDIVKHWNPPIHIHDSGKPIAYFFNPRKQEKGWTNSHTGKQQ